MSDEFIKKTQRDGVDREVQERSRREQIRIGNLRGIAAYGQGNEQPQGAVERDSPVPCQSDTPAAYDRISDLFSIDFRTETDPRLFEYGAHECDHLADILERQIAHLEHHKADRYYLLHFQGDLGEHSLIAQWEGAGQVKNLNDSAKLHDNHRGTDVRVDTEDHERTFEADVKVSLSHSPESYYIRKLTELDSDLKAGSIDPDAAYLFVPEDQVQLTRDAIDRRFEHMAEREPERAAEFRDAAERWKSRVHEGPLPSDTYKFVLRHCRESSESTYISLEKLRSLRDDLRTTGDYLRQRSERIGQGSYPDLTPEQLALLQDRERQDAFMASRPEVFARKFKQNPLSEG